MAEFTERYINPFTDFGFKKLFGEEPNKELLLEDSLKYYRDLKNSLDTAKEEGIELGIELGIEKGIEKGKLAIAKNALNEGLSIELIQKITGLSKDQLETIKRNEG